MGYKNGIAKVTGEITEQKTKDLFIENGFKCVKPEFRHSR